MLVYTTAPFEKGIRHRGLHQSHALSLVFGARWGYHGEVRRRVSRREGLQHDGTEQRLRYRDGIYKEALMSPGKTYKVTLGQMVVASHFVPGHRIRIEIADTNFPEHERNMHASGSNFDEVKPVVAGDKTYHDRDHASFLELPLIQ